ncbi:MAG TPA: MFS transporter [Pirellulales bacterium]|nr:MFS transporter [Pirellulales bacterium]
MHRPGSLLIIFLTVFIDLLGFGIVLPLLPLYGRQFAADYSLSPAATGWTIGLLMSSFSAMQFLFAPWWGRLSDRIGRRPVLLVGLAGSVVFYFLFGIATLWRNMTLLFVSRIGAGIAGATISTAQAYIADTTSKESRTKGMALIGAAFGLGFTFGPLFGYLAVPSGTGDPGAGPGYAAAALSFVALGLAIFLLPESLSPESERAARRAFDFASLRDALATPSIGVLLLTNFICVLSFANFESTMALLIKDEAGHFRFTFQQVCLTFAYVGLALTVVQGGIVRRVSGRMAEATMAAGGAVTEIVGFLLLGRAALSGSIAELLVALAVVVAGFAFITPSVNSLLSRRSDPTKQGGVLGLAQSTSALARILGPLLGNRLFASGAELPLWLAAGLMGVGLVLVLAGARRGHDYGEG